MTKATSSRGRGERISDALREQIIHDIKRTEMTLYAIAKKYRVSYMTVWLISQKASNPEQKSVNLQQKAWAERKPYLSAARAQVAKMRDSLAGKSEAELRSEILRLQKELAIANLRAEALDTMIDIAEQQEGIRIRKKSGAKQ